MLAAMLLVSSLGRALGYVQELEERFAKIFGPTQPRASPGAWSKPTFRHLQLELPWATHGCDANPAGPGGQINT